MLADPMILPQASTETLRRLQVSVQPTRILLAEDDAELRRLMLWALEKEGYEVTQVSDGSQLLERLQRRFLRSPTHEDPMEFDAIVTDVRMPGLSGLEILRLFRLYDRGTPALVVTAFADEDVSAQAQGLGRAAVLPKPFELFELCAAVRGLIARSL